jgi:hypothetical protein
MYVLLVFISRFFFFIIIIYYCDCYCVSFVYTFKLSLRSIEE